MTQSMTIMLAGGGTGGHLFPAIAIADEFSRRFGKNCEIIFVGSQRGLDEELITKMGYHWVGLAAAPIKGKSLFSKIVSLLRLPFSIISAWFLVRRYHPLFAIGVGGYISGPLLVAAKILGVPTAVAEQNSVPGLTNRLLSHVVDRVFLTFECSASFFPNKKAIVTGNPVRESIRSLPVQERDTDFHLLVFGGSQGARRLNLTFVEALPKIAQALPQLKVVHQTGKQNYEDIQKKYQGLETRTEVKPFIYDMAREYARADLIVSRAGATSLSELAVVGKPAILVPFPFATDDHQRLNAQAFVDKGAALMILEKDLTADTLATTVIRLAQDEEKRRTMSQHMKKMAVVDAERKIVDECLRLTPLGEPHV